LRSGKMVILRRKKIQNDSVSYYYKLSEELKEGVLTYFPQSDICRTEVLAENDEDDFDMFRDHAFCAIIKFYRTNDYPKEKIIMWG
jgi:hypothetical protein